MTLRMADGPVANLPAGLDAYAGYVNHSGIGVTFPQIQTAFPAALHLSITTNGAAAMCADVESGAMSSWKGYDWGYCSVSSVNALIARDGRPRRLWVAHYTGTAHICSPGCWPGLATTADGTQWTDHGGVWDESLLSDQFFDLTPPPPAPAEGDNGSMIASTPGGAGYWCATFDGAVNAFGDAQYKGGMWGKLGGTHIVGIAGSGDDGYWLLASDGGVFAFGSAKFMGRPDRV